MFGIFRTLLAINVVFYHLVDVALIGPLAVYSFFILSGYLMTTIMQKSYGYSSAGVGKYFLNRFLRLYPVYWVLIILTLCLHLLIGESFVSEFHQAMRLPESTNEVLANMLMIFPGGTQYVPRLLPATWALTIEIFFYILIGLGISKTPKATLVWLAASLAYVAYINLVKKELGFQYGDIYSASLPFAIGASLYHFSRVLEPITRSKEMHFVVLGLFIANLCAGALVDLFAEAHSLWKINFVVFALNMLFTAMLILVLAQLAPSSQWRQYDKLIGDYSYPIYLFHWSAACVVSWIFYGRVVEHSELVGWIVMACALILCFAVSYFVNKFVNDKIDKVRARVRQNNRHLQSKAQ